MANFITINKHRAMTIEEIKEEQKNHRAKMDALTERTKTQKVKTDKRGLQIGETITTDDIEKLYLTANANAKSATEIKRDHMTAPNKFIYLDKTVDAHNKLFYTINNGGHAHGYNADAKTLISKQEEDAHDGVQSAVIPLLENIGKEYTANIRKASRNAVSRDMDARNRDGDDMNAVSIEGEREKAGDAFDALVIGDLFNVGDGIKNPVLVKAIQGLNLKDKDVYIFDDMITGVHQSVTAENLNITQQAVSKRRAKIVAELQAVLVLENGRVKAK